MDAAEKQWMLFVDGENFTIRGQRLARMLNQNLVEGRYHKLNCFAWFPNRNATGRLVRGSPSVLQPYATRAYYYTSLVGDDATMSDVNCKLWELGFTAKVFKRNADQSKSKGVDIALCTDMLSHAFQEHFEAAVLVAGDGDYVPLVEQVKRLGKLIYIWFFANEGMNPALRLASDGFFDLTEEFVSRWRDAIERGLTDLPVLGSHPQRS